MNSTKTAVARILFLFVILLTGVGAYSQSIKGNVTDAKTGEPMDGATVLIKETGKKQFVQLDGNFVFRTIAPGTYDLEISYANYQLHNEKVTVQPGKTVELKITLESKVLELSTVTVVAENSGTDKNIRSIEKNSNQLVNIVSAKNIQLLPDITVANVLQRVSGVTIERSGSGEARYPIIRGMEKRSVVEKDAFLSQRETMKGTDSSEVVEAVNCI